MVEEALAIDPREFRQCMGRFATGVTILTTEVEGETHGMTANAFMSVSLNPPLVLVSIGHKAHMHALLQSSMRYGVSILNETQRELSDHFAGKHNPTLEIPFVRQADMPLIKGAVAHVVTKVVDKYEVGDHSLFIGRVEYLKCTDQNPLLFFGGNYSELSAETVQAYYTW